jgi:hypothetical protein
MLHQVKDLSIEERRAVERLLGRSVTEDETVSIKTVSPLAVVNSKLSLDQRQAALQRLDQYFAKVDTARQTVSPEEEEAILAEALHSARYAAKPLH